MSKASRRWEKPGAAAPAGPAAGAPSPVSQINSFVEGMSEYDRAAHRAAYLHLIQSMAGTSVNVDCVDGTKFSGVFHTSTPFQGKPHVVVVKAARFLQDDASPARGANDGKTVALDFGKIASVQANNKIDLVSRNYSSEFQTDSAIKKHGNMSYLDGRELQGIDSSWLETAGDMSLDGKSGSKPWDQFETNRRLFNVKDTYDENLYTKRLDLKSMSAEQIARAERLAREIEGSSSSNVHLQEERGQICETDMDEEDRYSGVLKSAPDGSTGGNARKGSAATVADANNPWKRGTKLAGATSGSTSGTTSKSVSPPPGVGIPAGAPAPGLSAGGSKKSNAPAPAVTPAAVPTAPVETTPAPTPTPTATTESTTAPATAPKEKEASSTDKKAETPAAAGAEGSNTASTEKAAEAPKPVKQLRAAAAEFKPSWMASPAAPALAPAPMPVPMQNMPPAMAPMGFVPSPYNNIPYNVPMTPDNNMYPNKVHNSPGPHVMSSPVMPPMAGPDGYGYDPSMGQLPPQGYPQNGPVYGPDGQMYYPSMPIGVGFSGANMNPNMMMGSPGGDFMMPMVSMGQMGQMGYPDQQMPGFFPNGGMAVQMGNMGNMGNMPGMVMMAPPPQGMMYGSPQQGMYAPQQGMGGGHMGGYNSPGPKQGMGPMSGDKGGRGGMGRGRGGQNNYNNGGRGGYAGRGYNNNMGSPQNMGMQGPGTSNGAGMSSQSGEGNAEDSL